MIIANSVVFFTPSFIALDLVALDLVAWEMFGMAGRRLESCRRPKPCKSRLVAVDCVAGLILLLCAGCGKRNAYVPPPPPNVVVGTPVVRTVTLYHEFPGTTQASQSVNIVPRVLGYIDSIHFTDGATVAKGQLLFVIDPRPYQDALDVAVAQVNVADAAYKEAQANYARAQEVAKTPGAISKQALDTYKATQQQGQANLQLAQANRANAKLNVDFTHITAPIGGKMSRRLVDIGNLVTANSTVLTTLAQYDPMYAYFNASEADFLAYLKRQRAAEASEKAAAPDAKPAEPAKPGPAQSAPSSASEQHIVEMGLSNETGYPHKGTIDFADNRVDPATGTLLLRGVFPNPQPYLLAPGLFVRIRVPIGMQSGALLVPDRALGTDQQGKFLLIVRADDVVEHRSVSIGSLAADDLRIVDSGLKPGEQFIVEGLQFAQAGAKVNPVRASSAAAASGQSSESPAPPAKNPPQR